MDGGKHGIGQGGTGIGIPGGIVGLFTDPNSFDFPIHHMHRKALASAHQSLSNGTLMRQLHIESLGQITVRISHEIQKTNGGFLIFGPSYM
jgi:hypothetical protein